MKLSDLYTTGSVAKKFSSDSVIAGVYTRTFDELFPDINTEFDTTILFNNGSTSEMLNKGAYGSNFTAYNLDNTLHNGEPTINVEFLGCSIVNNLPDELTAINLSRKITTRNVDYGYDWNSVKNCRFITNIVSSENIDYTDYILFDISTTSNIVYNFNTTYVMPYFYYKETNEQSGTAGYVHNPETLIGQGTDGNNGNRICSSSFKVYASEYNKYMPDTKEIQRTLIGDIVFAYKINGEYFLVKLPLNTPDYGYKHFCFNENNVYEYLTIGGFGDFDDGISGFLPKTDETKGAFAFETYSSHSYRKNSNYFVTANCAIYTINSCGLRWILSDVLTTAKAFRDNVRLGVMDKNGIVNHKEWITGETAIQSSDNPNKDTSYDNIPDRPSPGGSDNDEDSEYTGSGWLGSDHVSINTGLTYRKMTSAQMDDFRGVIEVLKSYNMAYTQYMRNAAAAGIKKDIAEENWKATFPSVADYTASIYSKYGYGSDPVNSIISVIAFPCNIPSSVNLPIKDIGALDLYISIPVGYTVSGEVEFVNVNYYTASGDYGTVHSYPNVSQDSFKISLASYTITHPKGYTDFRAYAPYTRLELYIPMHGTIDLDPAVVMGKTLSVIVSVTVADGSSVATVLIDGKIYQTINGQVGYSIPLSVDASSTNNLALKSLSAQSQSQRLNAIGNIIHGLGSTATSIATGNYGSALGSAVDTIMTGQQNAINTRAIKYQIEHATDGKIVVGQPSSLNGFMVNPKCQLIWHLPLMQGYNSSIYGKTVGYKCHKTATLGSLSGYTECSNAILDNVSCTEAEKAIILEQLKNGIII